MANKPKELQELEQKYKTVLDELEDLKSDIYDKECHLSMIQDRIDRFYEQQRLSEGIQAFLNSELYIVR